MGGLGIKEWLAVVALAVSVSGIAVSVAIPEVRCMVGLEPCESSVPVASSARTGPGVSTSSPYSPATSQVKTQPSATPSPDAVVTVYVPSETTSQADPPVEHSPWQEPVSNFEQYEHRDQYTGQVWIQITPAAGNENVTHEIHIVWGPLEYRNTYLIGESLSLVHEKTKSDSIPIDVYVTPAARIEFGEGSPPGYDVESIDKGWTERN